MKSQNTVMESISGRVFQYAKRVALSTPGKFLLAVAVIISLVSVPPLTRANDRSGQDRNGHGRNEQRTLTGNWMVTVTRINPPPNLAPTFLSLMTFFEDGNVLEESNTTSIRSTGRGTWERIGHQHFANSFTFFRFDAARTYLGTRVVTSVVALSEDGREFQANDEVQDFDQSGNLVIILQSTETGRRF